MKKTKIPAYDNIDSYKRLTQNVRRFYFINLFLFNNIFSHDAERGFTYTTQGEYLADVYGWIVPFQEFVQEFRKWCNNESKEYTGKGAFASQISKLMRKGISLPKSMSFKKELIFGDTIKIDLFKQKNLLNAVTDYLKAKFGAIEKEAMAPVQDCAKRVLSGDWKFILDPTTAIILSDLNHKSDYYALLSALLVFAQSGSLPKEKRSSPLPNIYMSSKGEIQELFSLEERCLGAKKITIANYAGTSLLSGRAISYDCETAWERFLFKVQEGGCETIIVLTDPTSFAAEDAVKYKMRPRSYQMDQSISSIIPSNIEKMKANIKNYPEWNLRLFLTPVALPCAYFRSEFEDPNRDNIKIDLYLPNYSQYSFYEQSEGLIHKIEEMRIPDEFGADDEVRQSFMVYKQTNPKLYLSFSKNLDNIVANSVEITKTIGGTDEKK